MHIFLTLGHNSNVWTGNGLGERLQTVSSSLTSILSADLVAGVLIFSFSREYAALKLARGTRH